MSSNQSINPGSLAAWKIAFRPHTLWLTAVPVAAGAALAFALQHALHWPTLVLALLCAVMIQVITNLQNDVGYTDRGAETGARIGFPRATQNGWLTARQIRIVLMICVGITVLLGLPLVIWHGWLILALGVLSIIAAILYMAGVKPIAFTPWGEVAVFIFFGLVAVNGTVYLLTHNLPWQAWPVACAVGLIAAAVLLVNNYRDIEHDQNTGRRTLPIVFGLSGARRCYAAMIFLPFALLGALTALSPWFLLPMLALPFAWRTWRAFCTTPPGLAFNGVMLRTVRLEALYGGLFVVAGILAGINSYNLV
ncbi:MAG: 1,4-dihydroxy-2-naphthoate octaprenyltransferase [Proteobacteria bacterium]|nr:1,4-dihydroxy-2-naphthoate octaprenyltransferase [Pseudomonadota bacterium]